MISVLSMVDNSNRVITALIERRDVLSPGKRRVTESVGKSIEKVGSNKFTVQTSCHSKSINHVCLKVVYDFLIALKTS